MITESTNAILDREACLTSAPIRVIQFGSRSRRLHGIVDEPQPGAYCGRSVVLCYPQGQDYATAFRSFRVLATRLRNAGCRVLRFDYYGTGDSEGDLQDASVDQWVADVCAAIREVRLMGLTDVSVVGLRLGAALAALAARQEPIARLALWEPVLDGAAYLGSLRTMHETWMQDERRNGRSAASTDEDVFGDRPGVMLREQLTRIDLWSLSSALPSVQLVWHGEEPQHEQFASALRQKGASVTTTRVDGPTIWSRSPVMPEPAVPNRALQAVISFLVS